MGERGSLGPGGEGGETREKTVGEKLKWWPVGLLLLELCVDERERERQEATALDDLRLVHSATQSPRGKVASF